ncbi:MAG: methyltransferase domain-containing protein [Firmicutes bacterium]|nr:methyltransferase domain-containing protein [Bacillota bacterium]
MANNWKSIWEKRSADERIFESADVNGVFVELKKTDGFDIPGGKPDDNAFLKQHNDIRDMLFDGVPTDMEKSIYEVGCGSGAELYMFEHEGFACGGMDYSEKLSSIAKKVLKTKDITCAEACELPVAPKYTAVLSNSVFSYFTDADYAKKVLEKMYLKTNYSIGLIDLYNIEKKDEFFAYRRATVENFDEKYAGLDKTFYSKAFFEDFADKHGMKAVFLASEVEGYWNNRFIFNCYMYKK